MESIQPESIACEGIPLLAQIARLRFVRGHALLGTLGIHPSQYHLLALLAREDGLSQTEIATHLYIKASTLTVMVARMVRSDLIYRTIDAQDARVHRVHITQKGRALIKEADSRFSQIEEETFASFDDGERALFDQLASRIRDNLVKAAQGEDSTCPWC
jgi:DNA-binding MarR family transcriptional regulator